MGEVGEGVHQACALLGGQRRGVFLKADEPGGLDALEDLAAAGGDADALHAPIGGVLGALEPAAAQRRKLDAAVESLMEREDLAQTYEALKGSERA